MRKPETCLRNYDAGDSGPLARLRVLNDLGAGHLAAPGQHDSVAEDTADKHADGHPTKGGRQAQPHAS